MDGIQLIYKLKKQIEETQKICANLCLKWTG